MRLSQNSSLIGNLTGGRGFNYDSGHQLYNKKTLRIDDINEAQTLKARGLRGYQSIYFRIFLVKIFYQLFFSGKTKGHTVTSNFSDTFQQCDPSRFFTIAGQIQRCEKRN